MFYFAWTFNSSAAGDWVNCGICGEWAHFGCDTRQGLGAFKVNKFVPNYVLHRGEDVINVQLKIYMFHGIVIAGLCEDRRIRVHLSALQCRKFQEEGAKDYKRVFRRFNIFTTCMIVYYFAISILRFIYWGYFCCHRREFIISSILRWD